MLVSKVAYVDGQPVTTPDEFEVQASLLSIEGFEGSPEASNNFMILAAEWITCNGFEYTNVDGLFAACSNFDLLP